MPAAAPQRKRHPLGGTTGAAVADQPTGHPVLRVAAALLGTVLVALTLSLLADMLDTFSLAFPLFFLAGAIGLPLVAGLFAMRLTPPRYSRILGAGALAGLVPGLAGIWFDLHTLGNPLTGNTLVWPLAGAGLGLALALVLCLVVRRGRQRAA